RKVRNFEGVNDLSTCVVGAREVFEAFTQQKGRFFQSVHMDLLLDGQVTRDGVLSRLLAVAGKARAEDRLLLYLAGKGLFSGDEDREYSPGCFRFLCSDSDTERPGTMLSAPDVIATLRKLPCRCVILLDACHSGAFIDEPGLDPKRHVVLAACHRNES